MSITQIRTEVPRRVVTGHREGKSVIVSDGPVPNARVHVATPGLMSALAWATAREARLPQGGSEGAPTGTTAVPGVGETRLLIVNFPPDSVMADARFDPAAASAEYAQYLPGLAELFEAEHPGMHTTESIDYAFVLDGEIWLELDDGVQTRLTTGDIAVQCGTRHAWRNKGDRPTAMAFVLIGTSRY